MTSPSAARYQNQEDGIRLLECIEGFAVAQITAIAYPIVILALATLIAFRERHLQDNFNEAKTRSFSTLALCIVLVAFTPTYYYVMGSNRVFVIAFTLFVAAFACMGCLFVPKIYIIFFRPEINVVSTIQETVKTNVTHLSPSFQRETASGTNDRRDIFIGHINYTASTEDLTSEAVQKECKTPGIVTSSKKNSRKDAMKSEEDEISSISEILA